MNTRLSITPDAHDPYGITCKVIGYTGQATLHWGDGTAPMHSMPSKVYTHRYPSTGRYMVTALDSGGVVLARQQVTITGTLDLPGVQVTPDDTGIRVFFDRPTTTTDMGTVANHRVTWPDGDVEYTWGIPGTTLHHDMQPGNHEVTISDTASGRMQRWKVRVTGGPLYDPDFEVHRFSGDESGMTVLLRLISVADGIPIHIWWDDADGPQLIEHPRPGQEIPHEYRFAGHYMQTVDYAGNNVPGKAKSTAVAVPAPVTKRLESSSSEPEPSPFAEIKNALRTVRTSGWSQRLQELGAGDHRSGDGVRPLPAPDGPVDAEIVETGGAEVVGDGGTTPAIESGQSASAQDVTPSSPVSGTD